MSRSLGEIEPSSPEKVVNRLAGRLHRRTLWDSLFALLPPLLAFGYFSFVLYYLDLISREAFLLALAFALGIASFSLILRYRLNFPPVQLTARLIDERVEGQDRFVTLATIDPSSYPSSLVARLRQEAARLLHRIHLKKDFPYRIKRSFFASLIATLAVVLVFHLLLQAVFSSLPPVSPIGELARELSRMPGFAELAKDLEAAADQIANEQLSSEERRLLIQDLLKEVEQLKAAQQQRGEGSDLLDQLGDALRRMEQGLEKDQNKGGSGIKTNLPEDREGEGKDSGKEGEGDPQGELSTVENRDLKEGKSARMKGQERGEHRGEGQQGREHRPDKEREEKKEIKNEAKGKPEQKGGGQQGADIPRGKEPERFLQPGEQGEQGIKGARFVTVQLPEAQTSGSSGKGDSGKRVELKPKVPVSNVPLWGPDSPTASAEKQPLPLEYRGLIR